MFVVLLDELLLVFCDMPTVASRIPFVMLDLIDLIAILFYYYIRLYDSTYYLRYFEIGNSIVMLQ